VCNEVEDESYLLKGGLSRKVLDLLKQCGQGLMAHTYTPSYRRRQRSGRWYFESSLGKKLARPNLIKKKLGIVVCACQLSSIRSRIRGLVVQDSLGRKQETLPEK
jgi:hypothetical protein